MNTRRTEPSDAKENRFAPVALQWCWPLILSPGVAEAVRRTQFAQAYEIFQASRRLLGTPPFAIASIRQHGRSVPVRTTVVAQTPFCRLLRFAACPCADAAARPRLLLCAPQAGHHATMMRAAIRSLLDDSDVYVTDWIDAQDIPRECGAFGLGDHVQTLERFMTSLGPTTLDVLAVCQATVPALAAAARLATSGGPELRSLVLMGGPIDARCNPTVLGLTAKKLSADWFAACCTGRVPRGYPGEGRMVYPGFLQLSALAAGQPTRQAGVFVEAMRNISLWDAEAVAESMMDAVDYSATMDLPAEFIGDTIEVVFRQFLLPRGKWHVAGDRVRPDSLRATQLLTVEGAEDRITGAEQTHAAHALCSRLPPSCRGRITIPDCDHYGLFSGKAWHARVYPELRRRLAAWRAAANADAISMVNYSRHAVPPGRATVATGLT
ncbi:polyhydroxyalkanoate depolymerase, intracellular [Cupriavidus sp. YR651]|uniref:polyhydroxyalkanoate depolymerase n=1 Tax=Cupriavidus sp. YR651 TaxID=1855315 RepID=UPI00088B2832|nr:polyhydroxyalkanoate depolymerase [Cupriavidus sp. YR651]SDD82390.1 polyhydroxyalkanoate depolymerase, intracellular [Cupriavidus sp. YR651]